jgi:hypothetical protein
MKAERLLGKIQEDKLVLEMKKLRVTSNQYSYQLPLPSFKEYFTQFHIFSTLQLL